MQDEKISQLNQQIHELTKLNRKCDKHRKRQLRFLQTLINSFKGDNVPLSDSVCTQECKKHNVKVKICHFLCTASTTMTVKKESDNYYRPPCLQSWRKQFNKQMRKYDEKKNNSVRYRSSNMKASETESEALQSSSTSFDKTMFLNLARLFDNRDNDFITRSPRSTTYLSKPNAYFKSSKSNYHDEDNKYLGIGHARNKRQYNHVHDPYSYNFDYSTNFDEPINVILTSKEDTDTSRPNFNSHHFYTNEFDNYRTSMP